MRRLSLPGGSLLVICKADRQLLCLMPSEETIPHPSTYMGTFLIKGEDPVLMETTLLKLMSPDSFLLF